MSFICKITFYLFMFFFFIWFYVKMNFKWQRCNSKCKQKLITACRYKIKLKDAKIYIKCTKVVILFFLLLFTFTFELKLKLLLYLFCLFIEQVAWGLMLVMVRSWGWFDVTKIILLWTNFTTVGCKPKQRFVLKLYVVRCLITCLC